MTLGIKILLTVMYGVTQILFVTDKDWTPVWKPVIGLFMGVVYLVTIWWWIPTRALERNSEQRSSEVLRPYDQ